MDTRKDDRKAPGADVIPLRGDAAVVHAVTAAIASIEGWGEGTFKTALLTELYRLLLAFVRAIRFSRTDEQVREAGFACVELLSRLDDTFGEQPWGNPSVEQLQALGRELVQLRIEVGELRGERQTLGEQLAWRERELRELRERLRTQDSAYTELLGRHEVLRQEDRGRLDRTAATLTGVLAKLREGLVGAEERHELAEQLRVAHTARRDEIGARVEQVGPLLERIATVAQALTSEPAATVAPSNTGIDVSRFDPEIERRMRWLGELDEAQQDADAVREEIEAELAELQRTAEPPAEEIQRTESEHGRVQDHIQALVSLRTTADRDLRLLQRIRNLLTGELQTAEQLFGQPLGDIPTFDETAGVAVQTGLTTGSPGAIAETARPDAVRRTRLERIAAAHGLTIESALIISLYDVLPPKENRVFHTTKQPKGMVTMLAAAQRTGILRVFGWESVRPLFDGWSREGSHQYLRYAGSPRARRPGDRPKPIYRRAETPLPWDSHELFSDTEIATFVREAMRPPEAKTP